MTSCKLVYSVFLFYYFLCSASSSSLNSNHKCSQEQTHALLLFKQSLSSISSSSVYPYVGDTPCNDFLGSRYYPMMMNWSINTDCCKWDGITCDYFTGDVIGIDLSCWMLKGTIHPNSTLFHLPQLHRLNLAFNYFTGHIPHKIGRLSNSLTHLNISFNFFEGQIPSEISLLPRLVSLDLSWNDGLNIQSSLFDSLLQNCTHLRELSLADVNISSVLPTFFNNSSSLKTLDLSFTNLVGKLPHNIFNLPHLEKLELFKNFELTGTLPDLNTSTNIPLKWLDLFATGLSGKIPDTICNFKFLYYLDLSDTQLSGKIPDSVGNLRSLNHLDIHACNLIGSLPKSLVNLTHLSSVYLSNNKLTGMLPSFLFTLPSLESLVLNSNMFSGCLPPVLSNYSALKKLHLRENQFDGEINQSFIQLMNLTYIDLGYNNFTGIWELDTFLSSLPSLVTLSLSYSGLCVEARNTTGYVNTDLHRLELAACNLTMFPGSLQGMQNLTYLDLSSNYIQGEIPHWAGEIGGNQLYELDLSYNSITRLPQFLWDGLLSLFLHSNQIEGQFPSSICNMSNLGYLDMSNNRFRGMIPQCVGNILSHLRVINMRNNSFHGTIPNVNIEYCDLEGLILSENHLEGDVPSFLSTCYNMKVLDIGNNYLNGTFPTWLENLYNLQILVLKSNGLHGFIDTSSKVEKPFSRLQILDLSHNRLVGRLPQKFFRNFHAMKDQVISDQKPEYMEFRGHPYSLTIEVKGNQQYFSKINVKYTIIDLSNNKIVGEIPIVIGSLKELVALNLSHNNFNGRIPYAFGNLSMIESLDLSWNQLEGEIPQSLVDIKFLAVLNLSQNHLVGRIPNGKQFDTFGETSFGGNLELCGHPLPQLCEHASSPQLEDDRDEKESELTWKEVMVGYGCGTIIGFLMGYLMLLTKKPKWFNAIADALEHTILKRQKRRRYIYIGK